jgi:hypothetical protein
MDPAASFSQSENSSSTGRSSRTRNARPSEAYQPRLWLTALIVAWVAGGVGRALAVVLQSQLLASLSSICLFAPIPMITLWLAWRTQQERRDWIWALASIVASFFVWNTIMLAGASSDAIRHALVNNAVHWLLFLAFGFAVGTCLQWLTGIGIWHSHANVVSSKEPMPGKLTLKRLLGLTVSAAILTYAYQSWMRQTIVIGFDPPELPLFRFSPDNPRWYEWFPTQSKLWVSGAIGGCLIPVHWMALASIQRLRSLRGICIVVWIGVTTAMRWLSDCIYWDSQTIPWERLLDSDDTFAIVPTQLFPAANVFLSEWKRFSLEALIQTVVTLITIHWLSINGFRISQHMARDRSNLTLPSPPDE